MWVVTPAGEPSSAWVMVQASADVVAYLRQAPASAAALTMAKSRALEEVTWVSHGWGTAQPD